MVALPVLLVGTIGTYADLVAKVGLWMDRDDMVARVPDFIALLEARLNREVRSLNQEVRITFTVDPSLEPAPAPLVVLPVEADASGGYVLPTDFRKLKRLWIDGDPQFPLYEIAPQIAPGNFSSSACNPQAYYLENRVLYLVPAPAGAVTLSMTYWARIPPLTADNISNWLIEEHPDIYLRGTLLEAGIYIRDEAAIEYLEGKLADAIGSLNLSTRTDRWGVGPLVPNGIKQARGARF